ncbi:MAG: ABC transporter permease [Gammaproteobacteria bacterium]|nr:ABC transporter permease [Gammaproteobacteria bacterium]MCH9744679.1 ABC transporter permease [Gammaproteobacteria bacterium]
MADLATLELSEDGRTIKCLGAWDISHVQDIQSHWKKLSSQSTQVKRIDVSEIAALDSTGAMQLHNVINQLNGAGQKPQLFNMAKSYESLYRLVAKGLKQKDQQKIEPVGVGNVFYRTGKVVVNKFIQCFEFLTFVGELNVALGKLTYHAKQFYWKGVLNSLDDSGLQALPILALMSFLIGIVLAYQLGTQLEQYGANIFIVDVTGIAILREFAPLITAVIMAGRTSTSFAALIGSMKINEELDALQVMGITPMQRLAIPRIVALVVTLPLLIIWSDLFAVLGSMIMAKAQLGLGFTAFLDRFSTQVGATQYTLGLVKGPFFAVIIAAIGCFQGFQVEMKAESVGIKTTHAAVQALFLIIIADAIFSVIFSVMGL